MPDKIIAATLKVDTDAAQKNVLKLNGEIAEYKKQVKDANAGSDEQLAAFKKLKAAQDELGQATAKLSNLQEKSTGHFKNLRSSLGEVTPALGKAGEGVDGVSSKLKLLLTNPIVLFFTLIVGAITLLVEAFTATDEGGQKVQAIFDGIGAVLRELMQRVAGFASAIVKLFEGDFKGAAEDAKKASTGFGDAMVDAFKRGKAASDLLDEVADSLRVLDVQYAAMNARLAKSRELLTDENASFKDKKKALAESGEDIEKYYKKKAELDDKEITAIAKKYNIEKQVEQLRKKGFEEGAEDFDNFLQTLAIGEKGMSEIETSIKNSIQSQSEFSAKQRQQNKADKMLDKQEQQKEQEESKAAIEKQKQLHQNYVEFTNKLANLQQENDLLTIKDGYAKELKALENKINDEKRQNKESFDQHKISRDQLKQLDTATDIKAHLEKTSLAEKHNKEISDKEESFQKELSKLRNETLLKGIVDSKQIEQKQLEIGYQEKLSAAIKQYKDDATKLQSVKLELDEQFRLDKKKIDEKNAKEDAKKASDALEKNLHDRVKDPKLEAEARLAAADAEQQFLKDQFDKKVLAEQEYNDKIKALSDARVQIEDSERAARITSLSGYSNALSQVSGVLSQNTVAGKALAVASASISTYSAIAGQLAAFAHIPIPGYAIAQAIATGLVGLANVKKIIATNVPGAGSGGGAGISLSTPAAPAAPLTPTVGTTAIDQGSLNQIGNATSRAYVLDSDVANNRERNERLNRAARLGG